MPFYLTPEQDDFNQERQVCIAEALYDVDSIVADPGTGGASVIDLRIVPTSDKKIPAQGGVDAQNKTDLESPMNLLQDICE